jgi:hypothetical protein
MMLGVRMPKKGEKTVRRVSVAVENDTYEHVVRMAKAERRTVAAMMKILLEDAVNTAVANQASSSAPPRKGR